MNIECQQCPADNPISHYFCSTCGEVLSSTSATTSVKELVHSILKQKYKAQRFLALETSHAIVIRLSEWAK